MFCTNCGQKIPDGAAFCPNCGAKAQVVPKQQPSTEPASSVPPADNALPLTEIVGKNTAYYLPEFEKAGAGQPTRFNWAGFLIGPYLCLYRRCFALFKKYYLLSFILTFTGILLGSIGSSSFDLALLVLSVFLSLAAGVLTLVNSIRLGRNFNREYYCHCKGQAAAAPAAQKRGVSAKNVALFVLILVGAYAVCGLIQTTVLRARFTAAMDEFLADPASAASTDLPPAPSVSEQEAYPYTVPAGTYQVLIGRSGLVSSIRLFENSSEYDDVWYCDVITWNGGPEIVDEYYGPATVTDDLQNIVCGNYTFSISNSGEPYFSDDLSELSYGIVYYGPDISMEAGLNALIEMCNSVFSSLTQQAVNNYVNQYSLDPSLVLAAAQ